MEENKYNEIATWASDGIQLAKKNNISLEDLSKMLQLATGLSLAFDAFCHNNNSEIN